MISSQRIKLATLIARQCLGISVSQSSASSVKMMSLSSHEPPSLGFDDAASLPNLSDIAAGRGWLKKETRKEYYLTAEEFKSAIEKDEVYVIDVREPYEVENGRVPAKRYVNIPLGCIFTAFMMSDEEFEQHFKVPKFQKHDKIVTMCLLGIRSTFACIASCSRLWL